MPAISKPGSIEAAFCRALANIPVPATRTTLRATWLTTNAWRHRDRPDADSPPFFNVPTTSALDASSAGTSPQSSAATNATTDVKASVRPSRSRETSSGTGNDGIARTMSAVNTRATTRLASAPKRNSMAVSVNSCRTNRPRPAPMAMRTAISLRLAVARVSSSPARLAHAMISTSDTNPSRAWQCQRRAARDSLG